MTKPQLQPGAPGRNDPCPCGSNKKYKKCCGNAEASPPKPSVTNQAAGLKSATAAWQTAVQCFEAGNLPLAQMNCEQALTLAPHHAEALQLRAMIAFHQQDHQTALHYIQRAIQQAPHSCIFYNSLGTIYQALGQLDEAEQAHRKALQLNPNDTLAHYNLGYLWDLRENVVEAARCYREALRCQPDFPEAHNNLGLLLLTQQQYAPALEHFVRTIDLRPDHLKAHFNLSRVLRAQGRHAEAQTVLERAIKIKPDFAEAWHDIGACLLSQSKPLDAIAAFEKSVQLKPDLDRGYLNIGNIYYERGLVDVALTYFQRAKAVRPSDAVEMKMALCVPAVYDNSAQVTAARERLAADLDRLSATQVRLRDPYEEVALTPFYLGYQGENEVELLSRVGDLFLQACPALGQTAPHCLLPKRGDEPIEIAFISSSFAWQNHIVNRVMGGVIATWPRDRYRITLLHRYVPCGEIVRYLHEGDRLISMPDSLEAARQQIANAKLDILFYCDLGMEPWTYFLSFARLARIQLTSGGHPITSGVPNVDYYVSSAIDEVPHAQQHYRERLIALPDRSVCYSPANTTTLGKTRADFGLPENKRIYFCPMTPFKLHPENDQLLGEVLRADAEGEIVFIINSQIELWERLKQRFARTLPDVMGRMRFLPFQAMPDFVELLRLSDVLLDAIKFNGGTTSLEALAVGTPIVTLPGQLMRQRCTYAMYNRMNFFDCVAQDQADYVRLATEIARRPDYREHLKQEILARNSVLYGQTAWVKSLSDFLLEAIQQPSLPNYL